jgi:hypothetical protein
MVTKLIIHNRWSPTPVCEQISETTIGWRLQDDKVVPRRITQITPGWKSITAIKEGGTETTAEAQDDTKYTCIRTEECVGDRTIADERHSQRARSGTDRVTVRNRRIETLSDGSKVTAQEQMFSPDDARLIATIAVSLEVDNQTVQAQGTLCRHGNQGFIEEIYQLQSTSWEVRAGAVVCTEALWDYPGAPHRLSAYAQELSTLVPAKFSQDLIDKVTVVQPEREKEELPDIPTIFDDIPQLQPIESSIISPSVPSERVRVDITSTTVNTYLAAALRQTAIDLGSDGYWITSDRPIGQGGSYSTGEINQVWAINQFGHLIAYGNYEGTNDRGRVTIATGYKQDKIGPLNVETFEVKGGESRLVERSLQLRMIRPDGNALILSCDQMRWPFAQAKPNRSNAEPYIRCAERGQLKPTGIAESYSVMTGYNLDSRRATATRVSTPTIPREEIRFSTYVYHETTVEYDDEEGILAKQWEMPIWRDDPDEACTGIIGKRTVQEFHNNDGTRLVRVTNDIEDPDDQDHRHYVEIIVARYDGEALLVCHKQLQVFTGSQATPQQTDLLTLRFNRRGFIASDDGK